MKKLLSILLAFIMIFTSVAVLPINAAAYDIYEGMTYDSKTDGKQYVVDTVNGEYWIVDENMWHSCIYNNDKELTALVEDIRQAMYNREEHYSAYFVIKDEYGYTMPDKTNVNLQNNNFGKIFNYICEAVYGDNLLPYGGDYLRMLTEEISMVGKSGYITASQYSDEYSFYKIELSFKYLSTAHQEQQVNTLLSQFNEYYIDDNELIANSSGEERKYYIVKTIYNFLAKNTVYDNEVYADSDHAVYPVDEERYRVSHTAYGALMGNIDGSLNDDFDCVKSYSLNYSEDSQGLFRVYNMNQGRSVCEGYTLVFYYLCKLNGIDCRIIKGDYVSGNNNRSDPHAWNEVYLKDELDTDYEWYSIDATFGSQCTQRIDDNYTFVDYGFFLRGTDNVNFLADSHQQPYDVYDRSNLSKNDYRFSLKAIDIENARAIITRRRVEDVHVKYVADGVYNLENYAISDFDENGENLWKIMKFRIVDGKAEPVDELQPEEEGVKYEYRYVNSNDCFNYYSGNDGYWYSYEICDYASGVEYICNDKKLKQAGTYDFEMVDPVTNKSIATRNLTISRLDMSDWTNYDNETTYSSEAYFSGSDIDIFVDVVDSSGTKLVEGRDFIMYSYKSGDSEKTPVNPKNPGNYTIRIEYSGNYKGFVEFPFEVKKLDISLFSDKLFEVQYGINLNDTINLTLGNNNGKFEFVKNKDYSLEVRGGTDYLDEGEIIITALNNSEYLKAGSKKIWKYIINKRLNLTSVFAKNNVIKNEKHVYTGSAIKPSKFTIYYTKSDGTKVTLIKDKDYKITGYGKNVDAGNGTVNVEFIGNYEGTAELYFTIEKPTKFDVTVPDLTYNGKTQSPAPKVTYNGKTLKKGVDYTVSGSAKAPGIYTVTVKGINNFAKISVTKSYNIKPGAITSLKKKSATASKITLSWASQGGAAAYQIYAYDTAKKKWCLIAQTSSNSCAITTVYYNGKKKALTDATKYSFKIRAFFTANGGKIAKYSAYKQIDVYTLPKAPALKTLKKSKNTLKCTWGKNTRVTGYEICIATNSKFTSGKKTAKIKSNKTTSYTFKGLKKGKTYYVRTRAYKKVGSTTYYSSYSKATKIKL